MILRDEEEKKPKEYFCLFCRLKTNNVLRNHMLMIPSKSLLTVLELLGIKIQKGDYTTVFTTLWLFHVAYVIKICSKHLPVVVDHILFDNFTSENWLNHHPTTMKRMKWISHIHR